MYDVHVCSYSSSRAPYIIHVYFIPVVARPLTNVTVTASGNTVTVMWSISSSGDDITGYLVYYHHPNYDTTITRINQTVNSNIFTEYNDSQRVYAVSVQALSRHLPSALSCRTSDCQRSVSVAILNLIRSKYI